MATNTTEPNRYLINLNSLNNVITSASGVNATSTSLTNILNMINTSNYILSANTLETYTGSNMLVTANLNLSNASIYFNNILSIQSNCVNGTPYLAFKTNGLEQARFTSNFFGIGTSIPLTKLDINGSELIRGNLYLSTFGTSSTANVYADGSMYAGGFYTPSDIRLKENISTFVCPDLPRAIKFTWKNGKEDIGVLAQELELIEPLCISNNNGIKTVDYGKLVVLCLAEIHALKKTVNELKKSN
jgi:hypothetical protein